VRDLHEPSARWEDRVARKGTPLLERGSIRLSKRAQAGDGFEEGLALTASDSEAGICDRAAAAHRRA